ncbi:MAG: hypothetical protein KDB23_20405 [Planctomycetales bacterium]|nr:hypothetical protein [Planctomycetales bacterium]
MSTLHLKQVVRWLIECQVAWIGLTAWATANVHSGELRSLYTTGSVAPGTSDDAVFQGFGDAGFDTSGRIVFQASVQGNSINSSNDTGIWGIQNDDTSLLIQEGRNLASGEAVFLGNHGISGIADSGALVINAETLGADANGQAIVYVGPMGVTTPATYSGPVSGQSSNTWFGEMDAQVTNSGRIYGRVELLGDDVNSQNNNAVWTSNHGEPGELFVRESDSVLGLSSPPASWNSIDYLTTNRNGMIAVRAQLLDGATLDDGDGNSLLTYTSEEGWKRAVTPLDFVPGSRLHFSKILAPALNDNGVLAFYAFTAPGPPGLYIYDERHGVRLIIGSGTYLPEEGLFGIGALDWSEPHPQLLLDNRNRVLFEGSASNNQTTSESDQVLWSSGPTGTHLVLCEGCGVLNRDESWLLGGVADGSFAFDGSLHASGWAAMTSPVYNVRSGQVGSGLWSISPYDAVETIISTGDQVEVAPGDIRTLQMVSVMSGDERSGFRAVDENGSVVLHVEFTDGSSGLMLYTVPEPSYAVASLVAFVVLWSRKRLNRD